MMDRNGLEWSHFPLQAPLPHEVPCFPGSVDVEWLAIVVRIVAPVCLVCRGPVVDHSIDGDQLDFARQSIRGARPPIIHEGFRWLSQLRGVPSVDIYRVRAGLHRGRGTSVAGYLGWQEASDQAAVGYEVVRCAMDLEDRYMPHLRACWHSPKEISIPRNDRSDLVGDLARQIPAHHAAHGKSGGVHAISINVVTIRHLIDDG